MAALPRRSWTCCGRRTFGVRSHRRDATTPARAAAAGSSSNAAAPHVPRADRRRPELPRGRPHGHAAGLVEEAITTGCPISRLGRDDAARGLPTECRVSPLRPHGDAGQAGFWQPLTPLVALPAGCRPAVRFRDSRGCRDRPAAPGAHPLSAHRTGLENGKRQPGRTELPLPRGHCSPKTGYSSWYS